MHRKEKRPPLPSKIGGSQENVNENHVTISKISTVKLLEILDRQRHLVSHKLALQKLPDKGDKIIKFKMQLEEELNKRNQNKDISEAMAGLSLSADLNEIEWTKTLANKKKDAEESVGDKSDDDCNPFKILATHSGAGFHKKYVRTEDHEEPIIITENDLEAFAINLCNRVDKIEAPTKFLPHKTLNKSKAIINCKRDLSSASSPISKYGVSKLVTLEESLKLQFVQSQQLKEIQLRQATERLKVSSGLKIGDTLPPDRNRNKYREKKDIFSDEEEPEDEDECENE